MHVSLAKACLHFACRPVHRTRTQQRAHDGIFVPHDLPHLLEIATPSLQHHILYTSMRTSNT